MQTVEQFREAIAGAGLAPPEVIHDDGQLHRFATNGKRSDAAGWGLMSNAAHPGYARTDLQTSGPKLGGGAAHPMEWATTNFYSLPRI